MSRVCNLTISDEGFVFDPSTGESFLTNGSGITILRALSEGQCEEPALIERIMTAFDVSADVAARDIADFLGRLSSIRLI